MKREKVSWQFQENVPAVNSPSNLAQRYLTSYQLGQASNSVQKLSHMSLVQASFPADPQRCGSPACVWCVGPAMPVLRDAPRESSTRVPPVSLAWVQGSFSGWGPHLPPAPCRREASPSLFQTAGQREKHCVRRPYAGSLRWGVRRSLRWGKQAAFWHKNANFCLCQISWQDGKTCYLWFYAIPNFPALPPAMAKEEVKASKRHIWYTHSVPDLIFACWWMFCNVFVIAIIILQ